MKVLIIFGRTKVSDWLAEPAFHWIVFYGAISGENKVQGVTAFYYQMLMPL